MLAQTKTAQGNRGFVTLWSEPRFETKPSLSKRWILELKRTWFFFQVGWVLGQTKSGNFTRIDFRIWFPDSDTDEGKLANANVLVEYLNGLSDATLQGFVFRRADPETDQLAADLIKKISDDHFYDGHVGGSRFRRARDERLRNWCWWIFVAEKPAKA